MGEKVHCDDYASPRTTRAERRRAGLRAVLLVTIIVASIAIAYLGLAKFPADIEFSAGAIAEYVLSLGPWGDLAIVALMIIHAFVPFPAELVAFAAGMCYGIIWGSVLTWIGAMLGASVSFALVRILGRPFVDIMLRPDQRRKLDRWTDTYATSTLLTVRLVPVVAFNLVNCGAALTQVSWRTFLVTTGIGILPLTVLMVSLGASMHRLTWPQWLAIAIGGTALWLGVVFVRMHMTKSAHSNDAGR